jgi:hypothetical protein
MRPLQLVETTEITSDHERIEQAGRILDKDCLEIAKKQKKDLIKSGLQ